MAAFFQSQLDFIFFVYGLAFVLLGVVCFAVRRHTQWVLPWSYLGLFGFTHGFNEWFDLLAFTLGDPPAFAWFRLALLAASFAFLIEFGRIGAARLGHRAPGRWIFLPLLLVVAVGGYVGGQVGLNGGTRYALGLVGCLWTAAALFRRGAQLGGASRRWLVAGGVAMAAYGLATGLVVPASPFLLAQVINAENFSAATGVPIQLFRMLFAGTVAFSVWGYEQRRFDESVLAERRRTYFSLTALALALVIGCGWVVTESLGTIYHNDLQKQVKSDLTLVTERLAGAVAATRGLAATMSGSPYLASVDTPTASRLAQVNSVVDRYSTVAPGLLAYVMDTGGTVIATSNRDTPVSLEGKNYGFRPYFLDALAGRQGQLFAVGVTTHEPGFYASAPIRNSRNTIIGVAVIKKRLNAVELGLVHFPHAYLVDAQGTVLLSSLIKAPLALWPAATAAVRPFAPQPLNDGDRLLLETKRHLVGKQVINDQGWSVVLLRQERTTLVSRLFGIVVALLISGLILLSSLMLQREIGTEMQFHQDQKQLEDLSERLEWQAITDNLTGAYNRLKFNEVIGSEIERASRYQTPLSLIMYDIDYFKVVNDSYGHQAGDKVLVELTGLVRSNIRDSDLLARWGGEEFMIIVPQSTCAEAVVLAEKLRHKIERHPFTAVGKITCSFGVAEFALGERPETLTARCDKALYRAKTAGRNRVESYLTEPLGVS